MKRAGVHVPALYRVQTDSLSMPSETRAGHRLGLFHGQLELDDIASRIVILPLHIDLASWPGGAVTVGFNPTHQLAVGSADGVSAALVNNTGHLGAWQLVGFHPLPFGDGPHF